MALSNDNLDITKTEKAPKEFIEKKKGLTGALAVTLAGILGATVLGSAEAQNQAPASETAVETTMDNSEANLHEETAKLFAQKLNAETGIDEGFVSVAKEEKLSQVDPVSIYLIQQQNSETGKWETKEIKVNGKFDARPKGTPGTKIVCAGEWANKDDKFAIYNKETRTDINSPWVSTDEYVITNSIPTDDELTRYVFEGLNPNAKLDNVAYQSPEFVNPDEANKELPNEESFNPRPDDTDFISTQQQDLEENRINNLEPSDEVVNANIRGGM